MKLICSLKKKTCKFESLSISRTNIGICSTINCNTRISKSYATKKQFYYLSSFIKSNKVFFVEKSMTKQNTCLLYHTFLYFSIGNDFAKKINHTVCESVPFEIVSFSDANTVLYNLLQSVDITHRSLPSGNFAFLFVI